MATTTELMAGGLPAAIANSLGHSLHDTVTAAGTTQATATPITGTFVNVTTTSSNTGIVMPSAVSQPSIVVFNAGANSLKVYPFGNEKVNSGSAGAAFSVAASKSCIFSSLASQWIATLSA